MSVKVMSAIWDHGPEKQADRFVLLALADFANDDGECWPSVKTVSRKVCMTERGVQKIVQRLESEGWLSVVYGGGRHGCNLYTVNPERGSPRTTFTPNVDTETPNKDAENPERGSPEPSLTINEPSLPPVSPKPKPPPKAHLPEDWTPTDSDREYAISQNLTDDDIEEIADDFRTYWTERTDARGKKSERGWCQAWKNRVRSVAPQFIRNRRMALPASALGYGQGGGIAGAVARRRLGG